MNRRIIQYDGRYFPQLQRQLFQLLENKLAVERRVPHRKPTFVRSREKSKTIDSASGFDWHENVFILKLPAVWHVALRRNTRRVRIIQIN